MTLDDFRRLNFREVGKWPLAPKIIVLTLVVLFTTGSGLLLVPLLRHYAAAGVMIVGLLLFFAFRYGLRSGNNLVATFLAAGLTMISAAGTANFALTLDGGGGSPLRYPSSPYVLGTPTAGGSTGLVKFDGASALKLTAIDANGNASPFPEKTLDLPGLLVFVAWAGGRQVLARALR